MKEKHHSGIFMMEMIMVVFFFILCASVCILVFVKGDRMSREASDLNQSVLVAQSVAEVWKKEGGDGLIERFGAEDIGSGRYLYTMVFEDGAAAGAGEVTDQEEGSTRKRAAYAVLLSAGGTEGGAVITVSRAGEAVYTLEVSRHEHGQE